MHKQINYRLVRWVIPALIGMFFSVGIAHAEPSVYSVVDTIYDAANLTQISSGTVGGAVPLSNVGVSAFFNISAGASAKAKYAADTSTFGYILGSTYVPVITGITTNGNANGNNIQSETVGSIPLSANPLVFAIYNTNTLSTWSTNTATNADGDVHVDVFAYGNPATTQEYILAFEDLGANQGSDFDYNDLVVEVDGVRPVPEPAGLILFTFGGLGIAGYTWRRKQLAPLS